MKKMLFGALATWLILASCSKSDDPTPVNPEADKFMSLTAGSSWNYAFTDNNTAANNYNYTITSTNRDSTAAGKSYHVFTSTTGRNEYYNISSSDYYTLQAFSLGGTDTTLENLYLKDAAAVNTSWDQNYTLDAGLPVSVTVTNKIMETGLTKVVGSVTYTNVIHVTTNITSSTIASVPGSSLTTNIHYYYAPKYGMILNTAKIDLDVPALSITQHTDTQTSLVSATIL